jgi:hypothetical protein
VGVAAVLLLLEAQPAPNTKTSPITIHESVFIPLLLITGW